VSENADFVRITTDELEVVVHRSPLLIEFRDAKTHSIINADEQPMAYDPKGLLKDLMFDPQAGPFVAAAKKLGFDEHFYGSEKRPRASTSVAVRLLTGIPTRPATSKEEIQSIKPFRFTLACKTETRTAYFSTTAFAAILISLNRRSSVCGSALKAAR